MAAKRSWGRTRAQKAEFHPQEACPLFRLSAEIRNRIYGFVLGGMDVHADCFEDWLVDGEIHTTLRRCVTGEADKIDLTFGSFDALHVADTELAQLYTESVIEGRQNDAVCQCVIPTARPSRLLHARYTTAATPTHSRLGFLDLPSELRASIYTLVLGGRALYVEVQPVKPLFKRRRPTFHMTLSTCMLEVSVDELASRFKADAEHGKLTNETVHLLEENEACLHECLEIGEAHSLALPPLQTSRQVHWEASLVPFQDNQFILGIHYPTAHFPFRDWLVPAQRLVNSNSYRPLPLKLAASLPRLRKLASIEKSSHLNAKLPDLNQHLQSLLSPLQRAPLEHATILVFLRHDDIETMTLRRLVEIGRNVEQMLLATWDEEAYKQEQPLAWAERAAEKGEADATREARKTSAAAMALSRARKQDAVRSARGLRARAR